MNILHSQAALQDVLQGLYLANCVIGGDNDRFTMLGFRYRCDNAPKVVARGTFPEMRELALRHGRLYTHHPALLFEIDAAVSCGEEIPGELYQPVAFVYSLLRRVPFPFTPDTIREMNRKIDDALRLGVTPQ